MCVLVYGSPGETGDRDRVCACVWKFRDRVCACVWMFRETGCVLVCGSSERQGVCVAVCVEVLVR